MRIVRYNARKSGVSVIDKQVLAAATGGFAVLCTSAVLAGPVYQPQGTNLTFGDVTHGKRVQSASSNPAGAAADHNRNAGKPFRGTVISFAGGLEYGNLQDLFDLYDEVTKGHEPTPPDIGPIQLPEPKPGIDFGVIWDALDPDVQMAVTEIATEITIQAALLAVISVEGHAKAWVAADAPFVIGNEFLGGAWTFGVNWSGSSKAYGLSENIEFDSDEAVRRIEEWFAMLPINRPTILPVSDHVDLHVDPLTQVVTAFIDNDSSMITKSTQTTDFGFGYSLKAWSNESGSLYLGAEAHYYNMQLSRVSIRFGDITDSEELFDAIRDADFRTDERLGVDLGALWVGENYQLGVQVTNVNEPKFTFPDVDLDPYRNPQSILFLLLDQQYEMDRQWKLEGSWFSKDRRWSGHLGYDADSATDPMGDEFQWATFSVGYSTNSWWFPGARIGYRQNLAGTKLKYAALGFTAFRYFNFDIASALDVVKIDGQKLPQGLMLSLGFEVSW